MDFIAIDKQSFERMKDRFEKFLMEMNAIYGGKDEDKEWVDSQEVCILLDISKRTLHNYKLKGIIPYSMIGNKSFFKMSDIKFHIEKNKKN